MKIMIVFGTRPEAIKMGPLVIALKNSDVFETKVCVTGQHREMLDSVLDVFEIEPDYDLNLMKEGQSLSNLSSRMLTAFDSVLKLELPDLVLVHGDTTTAYISALASFYRNIRIGHIEAGLRTWDMKSPFPEEFNRQSISLIADYHFAPTDAAKTNLKKEFINNNVFVTGNTGIDALRYTVDNDYKSDLIDWVGSDRLLLLTTHRRENIGKPMHDIFRAVKILLSKYADIKVIYPMHKNPLVREIAYEEFDESNRVKLIEPMDVIDFHNIMNKAYLIMTDSGGIQEEAPSLGKPVLVMRDTTERPEGVSVGTLKMVGTTRDAIVEGASELLDNDKLYEKMSRTKNPYGDGFASEKIVRILEREALKNE